MQDMSEAFKKIIFSFTFNSCLFLFLIIGIQNSSTKTKVNLFKNETIALPISFIVGVSFITGSITGSLVPTFFNNKKFDN
ncbi:hypothetical protein [uncultured Prochlorococcus sp.]|uniref:hypothetical protein n=1 Tax=uncultured Prochlorococcus sp. TaxID=159733 RepID=UPI00339059C8